MLLLRLAVPCLALGLVTGCASSTQPGAAGTSSTSSPSSGSTGGSSTTAHSSGTQGSGTTSATASQSGSGSGSSSSSGTGAGGCAGLPLCDDFEADTANGPPSSALWTLYGTKGCSGSGNPAAPVIWPITIDTTQHHSGSQSMKVVGGDSCGAFAVNTSAFAALTTGEVYARFYVKLDATQVFAHAVLVAGGLLPVTDGGVGFTQDQASFLELSPQTNGGTSTDVFYWATTDSTVMPPQNSQGSATTTYLSGTSFSCVEFHVSKTQKIIETWINGTPVAGLTSTSSINANWMMPPSLAMTSLGLGWLDFHGPTNPGFPVWFDDVALSSTRIGCQ